MAERILVAGGAGFIGSHLCAYLHSAGHEVMCLDNLYTGDKKNLAPLLGSPGFTLLRRDIASPRAAKIDRVDQIYNLACPASPIHYQADPLRTIRCSSIGMLYMLNLAKRTGARIVQASTSEIYGDPIEHPQKESYWGSVNPIGIRACYDEGKRLAETLCAEYRRQHGVDARIVRIFNTYGPMMRADDGRVVSNFIVQALKNEEITIYGDGSQTRSFQYVDDLVQGITRMMEHPDFAGPCNIGNPAEFTILELAEKILRLTGSRSKLSFHPLPADDPAQRRPDIALARSRLGWEPAIPLDEGLLPTIEYFRKIVEKK